MTLFAKGNVDVHDTLHSCRIGGELLWNGINEVMRERFPDILVRLKHEIGIRSDALLSLNGAIPQALIDHPLPLGWYNAAGQFGTKLFDADADAVILTIQPDLATAVQRHRETGFLIYPNDADYWPAADRAWFKSQFTPIPSLDAATSMRNMATIIARIREHADVPILIFNLSAIVPGETVHCHQGLGETQATRIRRFNLGLIELSEKTGISIVDVDTIIARAGADRLKVDAIHLTADGYRLVAEEVVRILVDLGVITPAGEPA